MHPSKRQRDFSESAATYDDILAALEKKKQTPEMIEANERAKANRAKKKIADALKKS